MKIFVLNPPFLKNFSRPQRSPAVTKSGTLYFPMWLSYAVGVLLEKGHEVEFIDAPAGNVTIEEVRDRALKFNPGLVVLDTSTPSINNDIAVGAGLKDMLPSAFVVLVGTHVSALPEEVLKKDGRIDAVLRFEYDYTLAELAERLSAGGAVKEVAGISLRDDKGIIIHNEQRPFIKDLDALPFVSSVYKRYLAIENYFNPNALYPMVTITTSRGCPFPCTFCVYPQTLMGRGFRQRSPENVVEEMSYIVKNFPQAKAVFFEDDTMTVNKKRCIELSELIRKRGIKISWTANARVGLDYETMKAMRKAGCRSFCVGFESGSQKILDAMKKKTTREEMFRFMKDAKKAGILIHGCFMAGLPGETLETLNETLLLAKSLKPDTAQFYPVMVYPGTEAYAWYMERGLISADDFSKWITPQGLHNTVVSTEALTSEDLVRFCDRARREFYLRPSYMLYKAGQMIGSPREIKRTVKSARTFIKHLVKGSDIAKKRRQ
ncbi:MAG: radical SAM protein [Deltaproteobacteria bacterium]